MTIKSLLSSLFTRMQVSGILFKSLCLYVFTSDQAMLFGLCLNKFGIQICKLLEVLAFIVIDL